MNASFSSNDADWQVNTVVQPDIRELVGETACRAIPEVTIIWEKLLRDDVQGPPRP